MPGKSVDQFGSSNSDVLECLYLKFVRGAKYDSLNSLWSIISLLLEAEAEYDEKVRRFFKGVAKIRLWNPNQAYNQV